jgi:curved DNA-binding protein CbpA
VQVSLDFYRILGVPTRATLEQLQQAFEDRLLQMPRPEYSTVAIAARKQLLEEAFVTLADPQKRQAYDQPLSQQDGEPTVDVATPSPLDIPDAQLSGALLLLQEIGAYPQILEIGQAYLKRPIDLAKVPTQGGVPEEDVILALALANLELGREQWQQSLFEMASDSLQRGLQLLEQEQRFPTVAAEIQNDLYKLRPYRILELLNDPDAESPTRGKGLALLQAMLDDRDGIDGNQDDQSGLGVNDFLRFVQQLREYMTVAEQQILFEKEASRPSAVASYLAVYALIARGVSEGKPILISRAKDLLTQLGDRQDIALEQGMCWLLLGQADAAYGSVLLTQDEDSLNFLRQYSEGAPDLIPGLYHYTENWLRKEVYPYFRDLAGQSVSLRAYFNDPEIQRALSVLETHSSGHSSESRNAATVSAQSVGGIAREGGVEGATESVHLGSESMPVDVITPPSARILPNSATPPSAPQVVHSNPSTPGMAVKKTQRPPSPPPQNSWSDGKGMDPSPKGPSLHLSPEQFPSSARTGSSRGRRRTSTQRRGWLFWLFAALLGSGFVVGALALGRAIYPQLFGPAASSSDLPLVIDPTPEPSVSPSPSIATSPTVNPSPTATTSPATTVTASPTPAANATASPTPSPTVSPSGSGQPVATTGPLSKPEATQLIQTWQATKAEAMGQQYNSVKLREILAEPELSVWQSRIADNKAAAGYWQYVLDQLEVQAVEPKGNNQATVKVLVKEKAQYYERGKLAQSYTDAYPVQYTLTRKAQQWLIQDMQVLR